MPQLGLGTWKSPPNAVTNAVVAALKAGYRHLDCAYVYGNESEVGDGLKKSINSGVVKREDVFITSKVWNSYHSAASVRSVIRETLNNLQTPYLDLYLIHWPFGYQEGGELFPRNANGKLIYSDVDYLETYKAMEELVDQGLVRHIGLSNFNSEQVKRVLGSARIRPAAIQVECHPYLQQKKLYQFCKQENIAFTAYSPLGSPDRPWAKKDEPVLLEDPTLVQVANKYNRTTAQICLRYLSQIGMIVIPKSVTPSRIESNMKIFDFKLADEDLKTLASLDRGTRYVPEEPLDHKYYPFHIEF